MAAGDIWWADGFESGPMWTYTSGVTYSTGYSRVSGSGYGISLDSTDGGGGANFGMYKDNLPYIGEFMFGFAFKINNYFTTTRKNYLLSFHDYASQAAIGLEGTGPFGPIIFMRRDGSQWGSSGTILKYSNTTFTLGQWYWVEGKVGVHNSLGYIELKVDGVIQMAMTTGLNTTPSTNSSYMVSIGFSDTDSNAGMMFDDLYIIDNTGDRVAGFTRPYLGDVRVLDLYPNADGYNQGWTPSAGGDHWPLIDETGGASDADFVRTPTVGVIDTYQYTNLPSNAVSVYGLMHGLRAIKLDAGSKTMRYVQRQNSTNYEKSSSDFVLTNSFNNYTFIETINPVTGLPWTVDDINTNAEFGFKLQA